MTSYSTVQKQQLGQLGAYLQEKRQEQGKSLEDISLQTYIRAQLLKAVEAGDTSDLPQPIFVQGFIRRYADALGLDGTNFSKQFPVHSIPDTPRPVPRPAAQVDMSYQTAAQKRSAQAKANQPEVGAMPIKAESLPHAPVIEESAGASEPSTETTPLPEKVAATAIKEPTLDSSPVSDGELKALDTNGNGISPSNGNSSKSFSAPTASADDSPVGAMPLEPAIGSSLSSGSSSSFLDWLPWGIGAAVLLGAIALIGPRIFGGGNSEPAEPVEATAPQTEVAAQPEPPAAAPEPEPEPAISDAPVFLQVEITEAGPSWMSVIVDGEPVFEGLMDPGTSEIWEGEESITMNVGNAGAALISANGSEPQPAGNPGGAEFLTFNAEE
ncbi:MAG: RodZ domain-containing protein [Cyanobacteria bacterium P01_H01_bin.21]